MKSMLRVANLMALVVASGCAGDSPSAAGAGGSPPQGTGGISSSGGMLGSSGGSMSGTGGIAGDGGTMDAGAMKTCPEYPHLPYDGDWVAEVTVTESTCADMPVGSSVSPFTTFNVTTETIDGGLPSRLNLILVNSESEVFRGLIMDDSMIARGPLVPGIMGADLTTALFITFAGNCLTAVIDYDSEPRNGGGCTSRSYVYATRPNSPWK